MIDQIAWLAHLKCNSLHLTHNEHRSCYRTAAEEISDGRPECSPFENLPKFELEAMLNLDSIWSLIIYTHTPIGSYEYVHATLEGVINKAMAHKASSPEDFDD